MKTEYIVGIGEILWDMLPEGRRLGAEHLPILLIMCLSLD